MHSLVLDWLPERFRSFALYTNGIDPNRQPAAKILRRKGYTDYPARAWARKGGGASRKRSAAQSAKSFAIFRGAPSGSTM